jgi:hypothetical protein
VGNRRKGDEIVSDLFSHFIFVFSFHSLFVIGHAPYISGQTRTPVYSCKHSWPTSCSLTLGPESSPAQPSVSLSNIVGEGVTILLFCFSFRFGGSRLAGRRRLCAVRLCVCLI